MKSKSARWLLLALVRLDTSAAAQFDKCERPNTVWAGIDQGDSQSFAHGVAASNGKIYIVGVACALSPIESGTEFAFALTSIGLARTADRSGNVSFHTKHKTGSYKDHEGTNTAADDYTDVTIHHDTDTFIGGGHTEESVSTYGMDAIIYQVTEDGVPERVFGADIVTADGILNESSVNGERGPLAEFFDIDVFHGEANMVAVGGTFRGKLTLPGKDDDLVLTNNRGSSSSGHGRRLSNSQEPGHGRRQLAPHFSWGNSDGVVAKVDMGSGKAVWAKDFGEIGYFTSIATTSSDNVLVTISDSHGSWRTVSWYTAKMFMFKGTNGELMWSKTLPLNVGRESPRLEGDADSEVVYLTGTVTEEGDLFDYGTNLTKNAVYVAALDVSSSNEVGSGSVSSTGPVTKWVVEVTSGSGSRDDAVTLQAHGDHLYVGGLISSMANNVNATAAWPTTCHLQGSKNGFIMKLNKANGNCVWAKDVAMQESPAVVTDGSNLWTFGTAGATQAFDEKHILNPTRKTKEFVDSTTGARDNYAARTFSEDIFVAKYSADDGAGLWAASFGGVGDDAVGPWSRGGKTAAMTSKGPVMVGATESDTVSLESFTIDNLQHKREVVENGGAGTTDGPSSEGEIALFAMLLSTVDERPPCIESCPSGEMSDAVIKAGHCYNDTQCLATGEPGRALPCFQCDPTASQKELAGPSFANHCFIDDVCVPTHSMRPAYRSGSENSACEWCEPLTGPTEWVLKDGFVHDRTFASDVEDARPRRGSFTPGTNGEANEYGMLFEKESSGCQFLPDMNMPDSKTPALDEALKPHTSGTEATRASDAISAVMSAENKQHAEVAWAHYIGDSATCTKSGHVCQHTPAALADAMGEAFETKLHYGYSVARVKVEQGLLMLQNELAASSPNAALIADLKKDITGHMLIPFYQGAIQSAHRMDVGPDKTTAQTEGNSYWQVIDDAVGPSFNPADRAYLTSMFASAASGNFNYCAASTHLLNNLPATSGLQYVSYVREEKLDTIPSTDRVGEVEHMSDKDLGILMESRVDNKPKECTMPPPQPQPPQPVSPPPSPVASSSNSLSDGEIAGIAVGAVVGGIVLLLVIGLVLRALLFKEAKPIFTCLEKTDVERASNTRATDNNK